MRTGVSLGAWQFGRALALPHRVVQPFAPVAGLALGMGDGIDDDVIVEFFKDDVEGEDAHVAMADLPLDGECIGIGG